MTTIRLMTPADSPAVAAITADAAQRALVGRPAWETATDVTADIASLSNSEFIVAEDGSGEIVGVAGYALNGQGEAAVFGPLVAVEGHGIGAWLAGRVETMARQHGAAAYSMLIGLGNGQGAAWAEWRGYQRDQEHPELLLMWLNPGDLQEGVAPAGAPAGAAAVRAAADSDLDAVVALVQDCFPTQRLTRDDWAALLPTCHVAELGGEVRGVIRLDAAAASLHDLCVAQGARHQGLAAALVAAAVRQFWAERPARLGLAVRLENAAAVALFRRLGFRREIAVARWVKREG